MICIGKYGETDCISVALPVMNAAYIVVPANWELFGIVRYAVALPFESRYPWKFVNKG